MTKVKLKVEVEFYYNHSKVTRDQAISCVKSTIKSHAPADPYSNCPVYIKDIEVSDWKMKWYVFRDKIGNLIKVRSVI